MQKPGGKEGRSWEEAKPTIRGSTGLEPWELRVGSGSLRAVQLIEIIFKTVVTSTVNCLWSVGV